MSAEHLVTKYIQSTERVFNEMKVATREIKVGEDGIKEAMNWAKNYLEDAKYYKEKKKFEVSLTSIAYCEGLLDALRLIGAVSFQWPSRTKRAKRSK